jgi:hypothetical protein
VRRGIRPGGRGGCREAVGEAGLQAGHAGNREGCLGRDAEERGRTGGGRLSRRGG